MRCYCNSLTRTYLDLHFMDEFSLGLILLARSQNLRLAHLFYYRYLSIERWLQLNPALPDIHLNETGCYYSRATLFGKKVHMFTSM